MDTCFHLDHKIIMGELMTDKIQLMDPPLQHLVEEDGKRKKKIIAFRTNIECGSGAFKKVYLGLPKGENKLVIWSEINLGKLKGENQEINRNRIRNEIKIGRLINKVITFDVNNLLKTYTSGSYKNKKTGKETLVIIQEYINNGTIFDLIMRRRAISNPENPRYFSPEIINKLLKDILIGLHVLHHNIGIIHRDIKPENIFIQNNLDYLSYSFEKEYPDLDRVFTTKIGDFGLSSKIPKKSEPSLVFPKITRATTVDTSSEELLMGGTPNFTAPEIFSGNYTSKVDIYSLGWTLFSLVSFRTPFIPQYKKNPELTPLYKMAYQRNINKLYRLDSVEDPDTRIMDREYSKISKEGEGDNSFPVMEKINELFGVNDRYSNPFPLNDYNYLNFFNDCISSPNNRLDSSGLLQKYFQIDILAEDRLKHDPFAADEKGHYSAFG